MNEKSGMWKSIKDKILKRRMPVRCAGGIVLNDRGEVLVVNQRRSSWSLPKGHCDIGEDELETAKREIYEESGVSQLEYIKKLARVENLIADPDLVKPKASASAVIKDCEIFVPLEGLIDLSIERTRLKKEIERFEGSLAGINKKLSNEKFIQNAAPDVVEKERKKKEEWESNLIKLNEILINLG